MFTVFTSTGQADCDVLAYPCHSQRPRSSTIINKRTIIVPYWGADSISFKILKEKNNILYIYILSREYLAREIKKPQQEKRKTLNSLKLIKSFYYFGKASISRPLLPTFTEDCKGRKEGIIQQFP